jgi:UDP-glucose 4-epimerase
MKKILITGNSGYIGSHLTKILSSDYELHGFDLNEPKIGVTVHTIGDIRKPIKLEHEYDAVIHLAALVRVGESAQKPMSYYQTNLAGTLTVLSSIKTKNFIFASTGAASDCESAYGVSKRAAEDCVKELCSLKDIPYTIFRFYNVIGSDGFAPTNPDGLMYNLLRAKETGEFTIFGNDYDVSSDGTCVRDYVHVNEICDALRTAIEKPSNQVESLGHGVGHSVKEIVNLFQKVNDIDIDVKYGPRRKGDIASSVLEDVSPYMRNLYIMDELLKVDN